MANTQKFWLLLALLAFVNTEVFAQDEGEEEDDGTVEVEAPAGTIIGKMAESEDPRYYQFLGIPYAEPPTEKNRFLDPIPIGQSQEPINATEYGNKCPQFAKPVGEHGEIVGDEDCLYLNVYTPKLPRQVARGRATPPSSLLPVVFVIHGGGFIFGNGEITPTAIVKEDIVVVSLNYRLGPYGFFSMGTPLAAGNLGLKDQLEALNWVNRNIVAFGGDPNKVTLVGGKAGAISATLHQLSPQGAGLFRGIVAQSGVPLSHMQNLRHSRALSSSARLAQKMGCANRDPQRTLQCLQEKEFKNLTKSANPVFDFDAITGIEEELNGTESTNFIWWPMIDGFSTVPVVPEDPLLTLERGGQKDVPALLGLTYPETHIFTNFYGDQLEQLWANWSYIGPRFLLGLKAQEVTPLDQLKTNVIKQFYLGEKNISGEASAEMATMFNDYEYVSPTYKTAQHLSRSQQNPVFLFDIDDGGENGIFKWDTVLSEAKEGALANLVTLVSDFAKHGDPTPYHDEEIPVWKPFRESEENYIVIGDEVEAKEGFHTDRMYFWDKIYWDDIKPLPKAPPVIAPGPPPIPSVQIAQGPPGQPRRVNLFNPAFGSVGNNGFRRRGQIF